MGLLKKEPILKGDLIMRNKMHSFAATPQANIPRSRFDMPCNVKFTGNTGKLIPFYVCEVLPGDTFEVSTSLVCRLQTLLHPLMDNIYLDTYYFYVPNRLVWDNWKHFCGEPDKAWVPSKDWVVPNIVIQFSAHTYEGETDEEKYNDWLTNYFKDSIVDYMGIGLKPFYEVPPAGQYDPIFMINALPIRAYNKIYDDWFRDENLIDPINLDTTDNGSMLVAKDHWQNPLKGGACYDAPKLHDYFTSALPDAQRGNPAMLVAGNGVGATVKTSSSVLFTDPAYSIHIRQVSGGNKSYLKYNSSSVAEKSAASDPSTTDYGLLPDEY